MRIMLIGDVHGDKQFLFSALSRAETEKCDVAVILGDVGVFWPGDKENFVQKMSTAALTFGIPIYFIDGNHENHEALGEHHDAGNFVKLASGVFYIPRGFSWEWGDSKFLGIGGAYSIDKYARVPFISWWANEEPSLAQIQRAIDVSEVDIVLSHDAPISAPMPGEFEVFPECVRNRDALESIFDSAQPSYWFHGHYHTSYVGVEDGCVFRGLAHNYFSNGRADAHNTYILDV